MSVQSSTPKLASFTVGDSAAILFPLPRITIQFCTQCKWMLRAAYYAQELLQTFSTSLGEVALQPSTGGTFIVTIFYHPTLPTPSSEDSFASQSLTVKVLWDRKFDDGFPETKELKRRVRDVIEPGRNLGHVDRDYGKQKQQPSLDDREQQVSQRSMAIQPQNPIGPKWETPSSSRTDRNNMSSPSTRSVTIPEDEEASEPRAANSKKVEAKCNEVRGLVPRLTASGPNRVASIHTSTGNTKAKMTGAEAKGNSSSCSQQHQQNLLLSAISQVEGKDRRKDKACQSNFCEYCQ